MKKHHVNFFCSQAVLWHCYTVVHPSYYRDINIMYVNFMSAICLHLEYIYLNFIDRKFFQHLFVPKHMAFLLQLF